MRSPPTLTRCVVAVLLSAGTWACGDAVAPGGPEVPVGRPSGLEAPDPASVTGGENEASRLGAPYVVLVSLDGFASRYLGQHPAPAITALAGRGLWAREGMIPVYPTKTFPNHYALATGMYAAKNGIVANSFFDPARGQMYSLGNPVTVGDGTWYRGEPLWVTAERQGMVAASYYWVGSEAAIGGVRPSYWRAYDESVPNDERVDQVLDWLGYPEAYRPHLVTLYFSTTDQIGHQYGPDSPEMTAAVASVDASVDRLVQGVARLLHGDRVTIIVLSDHGMDGFTAQATHYLGDVVPLEGVSMPGSGAAANVFVAGGRDRAITVRDAVNAGLEGVTAFLSDEVPDRLHYAGDPRIGDLILMPDSGHVVYARASRPAYTGFTHGWDNALLSMRALFVAAGPGLPVGVEIDPFEAVQVYPFVTRILGLTPGPGIDGDPSFWDGVLGG